MKKVQKHLALTLAVLLAFAMLPGQLWAQAAEGAYSVLLEPNMDGGAAPAYGNVAMVWDKVYSLVEYAGGALKPVTGETFGYISDFSAEGYAAAYKQGVGYGIIDYTGKTVIDFQYAYIKGVSDDGYAVAEKDNVCYLLNAHDGSASPLTVNATGVGGGRLTILNEGDWSYGYADLSGNTVIAGPFQGATDFKNGYAFVDVSNEEGYSTSIIDVNGNTVLSSAGGEFTFSWPRSVSEGMTAVYGAGVPCFMDLSGNVVLPGPYSHVEPFQNGYAVVSAAENGNVGVIDTQGNMVIPADGKYGNFSSVSSTGLVWAMNYKTEVDPEYGWEMQVPVLAAVLQVGAAGAPSQPAPSIPAPSTPAPAQSGVTANPTSASVLVNGVSTAFDAYSIDGNNYFKLRDLAYVLNGTEKQFGVGFDSATKNITLTSGEAYTAVGGEMTAGAAGAKSASPTASKILLDGAEVSFTAYNIGGNNYFKLRDVGQAFDFGIGWDNATKTITIDTSTGYTA